VHSRVGLERRRVNDGELRFVLGQFFRGRANEKLAGKQIVPRVFIYHANRQTVGFVRAGKAVKDEQLFRLQILQHVLVESLKLLRRDRLINRSPVDFIMHGDFVHHKFVFGRAAGKLTR